MARFFQLPNFKKDDYNRPDQKWTCGRACDGKGCPFGPDPQGHCHTTGECRPAKIGDRWTCTRPETHGGVCPEGPLPNGECCHQIGPCQPVLGLRARRGRWVWGAGVFTAGLLLCLFASPQRTRWENPGTLTAPHGLSSTQCDDCHNPGDAAHVAAMGGMGGLLAGVHRPTDEKCLQCHSLGDHPLSPHGLDAAALARSRQASLRSKDFVASHSAILALARTAQAPGQDRAALECVTCHQEHHGRDHSLTAFTNQQCQVCHQAAFASFSQGHPEFASYPYKRRTRIIFDHASHLQVHFADKEFAALAPKDCAACHAPSPTGIFMLVKGFEQTCAACHAAQIEGEGRAGDKGIAFFRVPGLDAATLAGKGHPVGEWPGEADGKLTPFMRLLLARDSAAAAALAKLDGVDLADLHAASDDRLAAAATLAWSVKSLFADLVTDGQQAMETRLGGIAPTMGRGQLGAMTGQLPRDGLAAAQAAWFPGLLAEVANYRAGIMPAAPAAAPAPAPVAAAPAAKPAAAGGDDLLDGPAAPAPAKVAAAPKPADDDLSADTPAPAPAPKPVAAAPAKSADDDLSADTPAAAPKPVAAAAKAADDDLSADTPAAAAKAAAKPAVPAVSPLKSKDAEDWAVAGGWYRSNDTFTLYYRPTGHADAFLTVWLTAAGHLSAGAEARAAKPVFAELTDAKGPGLCIKCHSLEASPQGDAIIVNWKANVPLPSVHRATKFRHSTHFSLVLTQGCQTCHVLRPAGDLAAAYGGTLDPAQFSGSFASVSKQTCVNCHNDRVAREDCLLCHNYHVGEFASKMAAFGPMQPQAGKPGPVAPHL